MRDAVATWGLVGLLLAGPASAGAPSPAVSLQVALDKPVQLEAADTPIGKVFQRLSLATGAKFVIDEEVYACLPYGEQTQLTVKLPQRTLREALSPMLAPLAMEWTILGDAVRIVPAAALLRMTRRATREELIVLGRMHSTKLQPTAQGGTVLDQLRKLTGQKDLNWLLHRAEVDLETLIKRADRILPATPAAWLDMLCHGQGLTWYLWGDNVMIVEKKIQIERQLRRQVSLRYNNVQLITVLLDLAKKAHVKLAMDPGVMDSLPAETQENFNLMMAEATVAQAMEVISGATGLVFVREPSGIKVVASDRLKNRTDDNSSRQSRAPFYLKQSIALPGGSVELLIPGNDVPEALKKAILAERQRLFARLAAKYGVTTQPATTQPAATQPARP